MLSDLQKWSLKNKPLPANIEWSEIRSVESLRVSILAALTREIGRWLWTFISTDCKKPLDTGTRICNVRREYLLNHFDIMPLLIYFLIGKI